MNLFSIFQATFEESLNLEDEMASASYKKWQDSQKQTRTGYMGLIIFLLMTLVLPVGAITGGSYLVRYYILKTGVNYLPLSVALILTVLFCLIIFAVHRYNNYRALEFYQGQLFQYLYILLIAVCLHLFLLTMFSRELTVIGAFIWSFCHFSFFSILLIHRLIELQNILYANKDKNVHSSSNHLKVVGVVFVIFVIFYYTYKWFFGPSMSSLENLLPPILFLWGLGSLVIIRMINAVFLPNILKGYYHKTYSEEYREWEGLTQQEWYGEPYFTNYIKGTEKEVKDE